MYNECGGRHSTTATADYMYVDKLASLYSTTAAAAAPATLSRPTENIHIRVVLSEAVD